MAKNKRGKQEEQGGPVKTPPYIRASDAQIWTYCLRLPWYKYNKPAQDQNSAPSTAPNIRSDFHVASGLAHKDRVYKYLAGRFNIQAAGSASQTHHLMKAGADLIHKPELVDHKLRVIGHPDFLLKEKNGQYRALTAKLSRSVGSKAVKIQLGLYRRLLPPGYPVKVYLDKGREDYVGPESDDIVDEFLDSMRDILGSSKVPDAPYVHGKCKTCSYRDLCVPGFVKQQNLTLLPGLDRKMAQSLKEKGYDTIPKLARARVRDLPDGECMGNAEQKRRIIWHAKAFETGRHQQLKKASLPGGTWIHFDVEGNPMAAAGKEHVYLWGLLGPGYEKNNYEYIWAQKPQNDKDCFIKCLDKIDEYRRKYPDMVLAHYSPAEVTTIRSYAGRYKLENHPVVKYLLGPRSPFFDLEPVVNNCFILPVRGYGLKDICKHPNLVNFKWEDDEATGGGSITQHNLYLATPAGPEKAALKKAILAYNRDDTIATRRLELWLRARDREFDRKIPLSPRPPRPAKP